GRLLYISSKAGNVAHEVIDKGLRPDGPHLVGSDARIIVDSTGRPQVAYQDGRAVAMQLARRADNGAWTRMDLPAPISAAGHGFLPRLATEGPGTWASDYYYSPQMKPTGRLEVIRLP